MKISQILKENEKEFDEKFPELWGSNDGREGYDSFVKEDVKSFLLSSQTNLIKGLIEEVEKRMELHRHNSIPSYTADLDEGCVICLKNDAFQKVIDSLKEEIK